MSHTKKYWLFQCIGWSGYAAFLLLISIVLGGMSWESTLVIQIAVVSFTGLFVSHLMRTIYNRVQRISTLSLSFALYSFLLSLIMAIVMTGISELSETQLLTESVKLNWKTFTFQALGNLILLLIWNLIYFLYHLVIQSFQQRMTNLSLEFAKNEAELNQLKNQLNPHFLFNSLNGIRALIELDPGLAKRSITQLSDLLRRTLQFGKLDVIPLSDELKLVQSYLDLEKMRFDDRLTIKWEIDNPNSNQLIPPFTLQLIVENAIKHGIGKRPEGGVLSIEIHHSSTYLSMRVTNPGKLTPTLDTGFGLENLINRLSHLYGKDAIFEQEDSNNCVQTTILIPVIN